MKMNMNENTIQILKNFSTINPSILFRRGNILRTLSPNKAILAEAVLNEEVPCDFGIYELSRFLSVISLMKNPTYELFKNYMIIRGENGRSSKYLFASENTFVSAPDKSLRMPSVDVSFTLTNNDYQDIMKASGAMNLPDVVFRLSNDGGIIASAVDSANPSSNVYDIQLNAEKNNENKSFRAILRAANLKMLSDDYTVEICSAGIAKFFSNRVTYWVSLEDKSSFE